jgi:hypothetical protein
VKKWVEMFVHFKYYLKLKLPTDFHNFFKNNKALFELLAVLFSKMFYTRGDRAFYMGAENAKIKSAETGGYRFFANISKTTKVK